MMILHGRAGVYSDLARSASQSVKGLPEGMSGDAQEPLTLDIVIKCRAGRIPGPVWASTERVLSEGV